jgi:hypothetical protein
MTPWCFMMYEHEKETVKSFSVAMPSRNINKNNLNVGNVFWVYMWKQ